MGTNVTRLAGFLLFPLVLGVSPAAAAEPDLRLVNAAAAQDTQAVRALLHEAVDVNTARADGATTLLWAAHWDDLDTADLLLRAGADVNVAEDHGVTPLARACENASVKMIETLLAAGADPNVAQTSGLTPVMTAARTGNLQAVQALLAHGADVDASTVQLEATAVMWAVAARSPKIVHALLDAGADPTRSTTMGYTPLMYAARNGDVPMAKTLIAAVLLAAGADVNASNEADFTALHGAAFRGLNEVVQILVENGADINARDFRGRTPFRLAQGSKQAFAFQAWPETADLLKSLGANTMLGLPGTVQERLRDIPFVPIATTTNQQD